MSGRRGRPIVKTQASSVINPSLEDLNQSESVEAHGSGSNIASSILQDEFGVMAWLKKLMTTTNDPACAHTTSIDLVPLCEELNFKDTFRSTSAQTSSKQKKSTHDFPSPSMKNHKKRENHQEKKEDGK